MLPFSLKSKEFVIILTFIDGKKYYLLGIIKKHKNERK